jgi:ABC-2 type transport system permease protein
MSIGRIIRIETLKLNRPANFVLLGLMLLVYLGIVFMQFANVKINEGDVTAALFEGILKLEGSIIGLFLAIFVMMNIGKEYSDGTLRKNIIDGYTRDQFFIGKLMILLVVCILSFILGKAVLLIGGYFIGHFDESVKFLTLPVLINSFMQIFSTGIWALFLIFLTRNTTISIVIYFVWTIVESIIVLIAKFKGFELQQYLPLGSIENALARDEHIHIYTPIIAATYFFLMLFIPYMLLLKRDIH